MESLNIEGSVGTVAAAELRHVRNKGVRLWTENGQLHYKAPKGVLTAGELNGLKEFRNQIVALLLASPVEDTANTFNEPSRQLHQAPLAFTQLSHWRLYQLGTRSAIRQLASATRLRGQLNIATFRRCVDLILSRHDALRTRIVTYAAALIQVVDDPAPYELQMSDFAQLDPYEQRVEVVRQLEHLILEPLDVAKGPLFGARLLRFADDEHVFIVAMEHMISDAFSMNIVLSELLAAYTQATNDAPIQLPEVEIQFPHHALRQRDSERAWIAMHQAYWTASLADCRRVRFPTTKIASTPAHPGWGTVPIIIPSDLKEQLREWSCRRGTTVVMSVFTSYVALVMRWCNVTDMVVQYVTDGRTNPQVKSTIGYFASVLHIRVTLREHDTFEELLTRVTEAYCKAFDHADCSYLETQQTLPDYTHNTCFNWVPCSSTDASLESPRAHAPLVCEQISFENPMLRITDSDDEPVLLLYDTAEKIVGGIHFSLNKLSLESMERFSRNVLGFVKALLNQPERPVKDIMLA